MASVGYALKDEVRSLISTLGGRRVRPEVVLMPDFFLDHFASYEGSLNSFKGRISDIASRGGGSLPNVRQMILRGGNAANTASALASLGGFPHLVVRTDSLGLLLLKYFLGGKGVDLSYVKTDGGMALTTALELRHGGRLVNIMLGDPASVRDFGFEQLNGKVLKLIGKADYVCVFNWNQNLKGTTLAEKVFRFSRKHGHARNYLDTGDPSVKVDEIPKLMRRVLLKSLVDVFSLNENEAIWFASYFDRRILRRRKTGFTSLQAAKLLQEKLGARIDLHTPSFSATFQEGESHVAPNLRLKGFRATGAGDAWNAANIQGEALKLTPILRLLFANVVAAYYVASRKGDHATVKDVLQLLRRSIRSKMAFERLTLEGSIKAEDF